MGPGMKKLDPVNSWILGSSNPIAKVIRKTDLGYYGANEAFKRGFGVQPSDIYDLTPPSTSQDTPAAAAPTDISATPHRQGLKPIGDTGVLAIIRRRALAMQGTKEQQSRAGVLGTQPPAAANILRLA